jgi:hypothetical protein
VDLASLHHLNELGCQPSEDSGELVKEHGHHALISRGNDGQQAMPERLPRPYRRREIVARKQSPVAGHRSKGCAKTNV